MANLRGGLTSGQKQTLLIALGWIVLSASLGLPSLRSESPASPTSRDLEAAPAPVVESNREKVAPPLGGPLIIDYPPTGTHFVPRQTPRLRDDEEGTAEPPGRVDGSLPVPEQLTPITLRIGDLIVGGCTMHNSNLTAAILVLGALPGDPPDALIQLLYIPGDQCFVLGSSGTRTTCSVDTSLESDIMPDELGTLPIAGPPPVVGGTIAILSGLEETAQLFGVPPPDLARAIGEAFGCETVII